MPKCPHCGTEIHEEAKSCPNCQLGLPVAAPSNQRLHPKTSRKAIVSLVLGILTILILVEAIAPLHTRPSRGFLLYDLYLLLVLVVLSIGGLVIGHWSFFQIKRAIGRVKGGGIALAGIVLGYFTLVTICVAAIVGITMYRAAGPDYPTCEDSAQGSIRTLETALLTYAYTYEKGFPLKLSVLGPPSGGTAQNVNAADLIDVKLAAGGRWGYSFTYRPGKMEKDGRIKTFVIQADPIRVDTNCRTHYFADETGVIRSDRYRPATEHSPPIIY